MTTYTCGAIFDSAGALLYIDPDPDETHAWQFHLGWPADDEIAEAKKRGKRFEKVTFTFPAPQLKDSPHE